MRWLTWRTLLPWLLLLTVVTGPAIAGEVIATVNGKPIYLDELDWQWQRHLRQNGRKEPVPQDKPISRRDLLEGLVRQEIAWQLATAAGVAPDHSAIDRELSTLKSQFANETGFSSELSRHGLSEALLRRQIERTQVIRYWLDESFVRQQPVTEDEVQDWRRDHPSEETESAFPSTFALHDDILAKIRVAKARPLIAAFLDEKRREAVVTVVENP
jgi:hypothetical protein